MLNVIWNAFIHVHTWTVNQGTEVKMAVVTGSLLSDILLAVIPALSLVYWYITNNNDYWDKRGVPNVKKGLFLGALLGVKSKAETVKEIYNQFSEEKFVGLFQFKKPVLMVRDPILINKILVKDFVHFQDRGSPSSKNDVFLNNLFGLRGRIWRTFRYKLTPTFTTGKLRGMFEQITKSGENLVKNIEDISYVKREDVDSANVLFGFTLDVISSCAFGVQFHPNSPEQKEFKKIVEKVFSGSLWGFIKFTIVSLTPKIGKFFDIVISSSEATKYFTNLTQATMKYRKENNIRRNDYFQLLLSLKEQEDGGKVTPLVEPHVSEEDAVIDQIMYTEADQEIDTSKKLFTDEAITANTVIFLTAGSETVSRTIGFVLFELSRHPEIQQRVQQEVDSVLSKHGRWSFEVLKDMTYLDQVIQESQRMHTILPSLMRECVRPYKMPDSNLTIEKGTLILIPVVGLHNDPQYYPDPSQFDPDRFKDNKFKPSSTYLPFGDGPRICIAMRFAVMEVKACVAKIVSQYSVRLSNKTKLPLQYEIRSFVPIVKGGIHLSFQKRSPNPAL